MAVRADDQQPSELLFALRDENRALKTRVREQDDKARRLSVQVQRLSEDLTRQRTAGPRTGQHAPKNESREERDLIAELRSQVQQLSKNNAALKTKMHFFKSLHEAESRRRTPYDHIPPRVESSRSAKRSFGNSPQLPRGLAMAQQSYNEDQDQSAVNARSVQELEEELIQQQQLVTLLRSKLVDAENDRESAINEVKRLKETTDARQQQDDIDRLALQHELNDFKKRSTDLRSKYEALDESHRLLEATHRELVAVTETLRTDLANERQRVLDLEHAIQTTKIQQQSEQELLLIIEDLRREKSMLEQELQKILDNQFGNQRDLEYQKEILEMRKRISDLGLQLKAHIEDKARLNATIQELNMRIQELMSSESEARSSLFNAQHEIEELKDRLRFFSHNGEINISEIEEALTMVRLKRERGLTLDFLIQLDEAAEDKRALQELRIQFAECAQELEKVTKLLRIQETLSRDYKAEVEQLKRQLQSLANEYELRLEEDAQLLDLRSQRIAILESQLKNIAYGVSKPLQPDAIENAIEIESGEPIGTVLPGQTVLDVHIDAAFISEEGRRYITHHLLPPSHHISGDFIFTFISLDFFEFETEITGLGLSWAPKYSHTMRYKVFADDYFLAFLQTQRIALRMYCTSLTEITLIGQCFVSLKDFLDDSKTTKERFMSDIISPDQKCVLGKIDYTVQMLTPITLAIRAFKERTVALNLLNLDDPVTTSIQTDIQKSRGVINRLTITIRSGTFLGRRTGSPAHDPPRIYGVVSFGMNVRLIATPVITGTYTPIFDFDHTIPLAMTTALDMHLRTFRCEIVFCDAVHNEMYGYVSVPLDVLARGGPIDGTFDVMSMQGMPCGTVSLSIVWGAPYVVDESTVQAKVIVEHEKQQRRLVQPLAAAGNVSVDPPQLVQQPTPSQPIDDHAVQQPEQSVILGDTLRIRIDSLRLHFDDPKVDSLLKSTKQVFVSFEFLRYALDELETVSISVTRSGILNFGYSKEFLIDASDHANDRNQVKSILDASGRKDGQIVFTLVDEPPEPDMGGSSERKSGECIDLGVAMVDLAAAMRLGLDSGIEIPVMGGADGDLCIGMLRIGVGST